MLFYLKYLFVIFQSLIPLTETVKGKYDFGPNQLASNVWYKPQGHLINGHFRESFSNLNLWSNLVLNLQRNNGSILIQSSEIGFMENESLMNFRENNFSIIVALPAFTQCYDGNILALLELYGQSPKENLFCSIFDICNPTDRQDPNGKGWFVTKDGYSFTPDLINFDERMPNLVPYFDYDKLMNTSVDRPEWLYPNLSWQDRKSRSRIDPCPQSGVNRIANLMEDYVKYISIMKNKFNSTKIPRIQLNWNVIEGWEWRDEFCLDLLFEKYPNGKDFDHAYRYVTNPCHEDTRHLYDLVQLLCSIESCPEVVYMDMDLTYITSYSIEVLRMNKQILKEENVPFGINLVDQCTDRENCVTEIVSLDPPQVRLNLNANSTYPNLTRNEMQELSLINVLNFLINLQIVDEDTHIAIVSWTSYPQEIGLQINETNPGGMAHTANRIFEQILIPHGFAKKEFY